MPLASLDDVDLLSFPRIAAPDRHLVPIEGGREAPFAIARLFTVTAGADGVTGGRHAHRRCAQVLIPVAGSVEVLVRADPAQGERRFLLDDAAQGLLIPPGIWSEQRYTSSGSVLLVLCDRVFEEADYIRDFDAFCRFRAEAT